MIPPLFFVFLHFLQATIGFCNFCLSCCKFLDQHWYHTFLLVGIFYCGTYILVVVVCPGSCCFLKLRCIFPGVACTHWLLSPTLVSPSFTSLTNLLPVTAIAFGIFTFFVFSSNVGFAGVYMIEVVGPLCSSCLLGWVGNKNSSRGEAQQWGKKCKACGAVFHQIFFLNHSRMSEFWGKVGTGEKAW